MSDITPRIAIKAMATSSRLRGVGSRPTSRTAFIAIFCGPETFAPGLLVVSASIDSSMDMPRPSNRLATDTAASARAARPG